MTLRCAKVLIPTAPNLESGVVPDGVTVAQQILDLFVKVRILVGQPFRDVAQSG